MINVNNFLIVKWAYSKRLFILVDEVESIKKLFTLIIV